MIVGLGLCFLWRCCVVRTAVYLRACCFGGGGGDCGGVVFCTECGGGGCGLCLTRVGRARERAVLLLAGDVDARFFCTIFRRRRSRVRWSLRVQCVVAGAT